MPVRSLGFSTDLMVRRLGSAEIRDHGEYLSITTATNPGFHWGNFLLLSGPVGPGMGQHWATLFDRHFPLAQHFTLGVDGTDGVAGDPAELAALGLHSEVSAVLSAPRLLELPPPAGVTVRPLEADADWAAALELSRVLDAGQTRPGHDEFLRRRLEETRVHSANGGAWFGAFEGGALLSTLGLLTDGSGLARFQDVQTHPDHRRRGLARATVSVAGHYGVTRLGASTLVIVADPRAVAIDLYRQLGFRDSERQVQLSRADPPTSPDDPGGDDSTLVTGTA